MRSESWHLKYCTGMWDWSVFYCRHQMSTHWAERLAPLVSFSRSVVSMRGDKSSAERAQNYTIVTAITTSSRLTTTTTFPSNCPTPFVSSCHLKHLLALIFSRISIQKRSLIISPRLEVWPRHKVALRGLGLCLRSSRQRAARTVCQGKWPEVC